MNPQRILVVDDQPQVAEMISEILSMSGYEVQQHTNPLTVTEVAQEFKPDILILDVNMPLKNGFAVLAELRKDQNTVPAIMLTGNLVDGDTQIGADHIVLPKTISFLALTQQIKELLTPSK